jgi:hypothetical protein
MFIEDFSKNSSEYKRKIINKKYKLYQWEFKNKDIIKEVIQKIGCYVFICVEVNGIRKFEWTDEEMKPENLI